MMEFISSLLKGLYPYFTVPAIVIMLYFLHKHQWKKEYSLLICLLLIGIFSVITQIVIADQILYVSRRYLLPFSPVLFGFTAWGIFRLSESSFKKWMFLLIPVLCIFLCIDSMMPIMKDYTTSKRHQKNNDINQMTMVINQQKLPSKKRKLQTSWWYEPRMYSDIVLKNAPPQLVWKVRGMAWSPYFPNEKFDYLVTSTDDEILSPKFILLYKGDLYSLYKHKEDIK